MSIRFDLDITLKVLPTVHTGTRKSLVKRQSVVTHTIHQTEIPTLLDSWATNTPSVKILYHQKLLLLIFS